MSCVRECKPSSRCRAGSSKGLAHALRGRRGIALVGVLWALVLLSVMAGSFVRETRTEVVVARNTVENAKARALADAGIHRAVLTMSEADFEDRWRADGRPYLWRFADGEVRISVQDEAGKIDLNEAPVILLSGLFEAVGVDPERAQGLADAVADYRDGNDLRRLYGAEDDDYRDAGYAHGAKDGPFEVIAELAQVFGMTAEIYERVAPFVTLYTQADTIEPLVAPRPVLLALPGITPEEVDGYIAERAAAETETDLELVTIPSLDNAADFISLGERDFVYSLRAEARTPEGGVFVREAVVVPGDGRSGAFAVLRWGQGRRSATPGADETN